MPLEDRTALRDYIYYLLLVDTFYFIIQDFAGYFDTVNFTVLVVFSIFLEFGFFFVLFWGLVVTIVATLCPLMSVAISIQSIVIF